MNASADSREGQLIELRTRIREIRAAKKWLQEYRINAPATMSKALAAYYTWLCQQEQRTIQLGQQIKGNF